MVVQPTEPELLEWSKQQELIPKDDSIDKNLKSLCRLPTESLYLFLKRGKNWELPESSLNHRLDEALHEVFL